MILYIILPIFAIATGFLSTKSRYGKEVYCLLWGITLFIIAAIRFDVGYDYILYTNWFHEFAFIGIENLTYVKQEKGFALPVKLMAEHGVQPQMMFVLIALIISVLLVIYLLRNTSNAYIALTAFLVLGFFFNSMCFMRQMIAVMLVANALPYIHERKICRYLALVLLASVFHVSALIMIPFYFLLKLKPNWFFVGGLAVLTLIGNLFSNRLLSYITQYVYSGYDIASNPEITNGISPIYIIPFLVILVVSLLMREILFTRNPFNQLAITSLCFGVALCSFGISHAVVGRLSLYFLVPACLTLTAELFSITKSLIKLTFKRDERMCNIFYGAVATFFVVAFGAYYGFLMADNSNGAVPYMTVFSESTQSGGNGDVTAQ